MSHGFYKTMRGKVDLQNCHLEPIHTPGAIQAHGVLFVCDEPDLTILQVSQNVESLLGKSVDAVLGEPIQTAIGAAAASMVHDAAKAENARFLEPFAAQIEERHFELSAHRTRSGLIVELELGRGRPDPHMGLIRTSLMRLREGGSVLDLCRIAAEEVRLSTGFDRVMIYRFSPEWNGEVVAEAKSRELGTFLGLNYPAADIPAQARRLYALNPIRVIPDVSYEPSELRPEISPRDALPVDLSHAALRSVSPIHCEYLRNMGIGASMSISLMVDGRLWGLIACHHRTPLLIPSSVRAGCELIGSFLGSEIPAATQRDVSHRARAMEPHFDELARTLTGPGDTGLLLRERGPALLEATGCDGLVTFRRGEVEKVGLTPPDEMLVEMAATISERLDEKGLYHTDRLRESFPDLDLGEVAGVLGLALWSDQELLLLFRREHVTSVAWGSRPDKEVSVVDGIPRLSPEGSFAMWKQTVEGKSMAWEPELAFLCRRLRGMLSANLSERTLELERVNEELAAASRARDEFLAMLSHELRNPLNAIVGWSKMLQDGTVPKGEITRAADVIHRNANVQLQLIEDLLDSSRIINGKMHIEPQPLDIREPVQAAIETLTLSAEARKIQVSTMLDDEAVVLGDPGRLQQVFWNLLSNAIKFSSRGGLVRLSSIRDPAWVTIRVEDSGQGIQSTDLPTLFDRFVQGRGGLRRGGLGLGLSIAKSLVELHGGTLSVESPGIGFGSTFSVRLPAVAPR